jgi:hypothetical protein
MSRILKRPMFKMGGSTNSGIMTGLVDRKGYSNGNKAGAVGKSTREYISEFTPILEEFTPKTRLPLGAVGASLVSGTPIKDALIGGYRDFTKRDDARTAGIQKGAVQLGLGQALKDMAPSKQSVLAAEKKARYLLPPDATADQIRAKTAEIIRNEMTGATYGEAANLQRAINRYANTYGDGSRAFNHAAFDVKVAPLLRAAGKNPRANIKMQEDGSYKTKGKTPGVYIDVINGKVIEFDGNIAKELPEYSAMLR